VIFSLLLAIYFSTFLTTVFSILLVICWLLTKKVPLSVCFLKENKIILFALLLFADVIIAVSYSSADLKPALAGLNKYRELLLLFILPAFFQTENLRQKTWYVFITASVITLFSSYIIYLNPFDLFNPEKTNDPSIKSRITHSIFMSFFAFYCLHEAIEKKPQQFIYLSLFLLATVNLFFIVSGRSGQLSFIALTLLFAVQRLNKKQAFLVSIALSIFLAVFFQFSDNSERIYEGISESRNYLQFNSGGNDTSMGLRLAFWKNTLKIISGNIWFGHGTGSFAIEYAKVINHSEHLTANPHNEYLMIWAQLGLIGLGLFLAFLYSQYRYSFGLTQPDRGLAQGLLLSLVINCFFNASFIDFSEGYWYAMIMALCFSSGLDKHTNPL
jgi:O-antigen ligase